MKEYLFNIIKILYPCFSMPIKTFIIAIFLLQVGALFSLATQQADIPAVIEVNSLDAAKGIETLNKTNYFNDNLWRAYGPLYYRLSKLTFDINKNLEFTNYFEDEDLKNIKSSYSLISVSTISLIIVSLLIGYCINKNIYINLICSSLIIYYLLKINDVAYLLYWNHPDLLMSFFGLALYYFSIKYIQSSSYKDLICLGIIGGLGFLTKISFFILYIPVIISLFIVFKKIKFLFFLILITFISYFLIGIPQSFKISGVLNFLQEQNGYRDIISLDSIIFWITELFKDLYKPVILIFFLTLFFSDKCEEHEADKFNRLCFGLLILPILILLSISFAHRPSYYVVPLVFSFLLIATLIFKKLITSLFLNVYFTNQNFQIKLKSFGIILFIFHISYFNLIPNSLADISNSILKPRISVKETISFVNNLPIGSSKVKTAYFPSSDPSVSSCF
jgi:hypothetical protein